MVQRKGRLGIQITLKIMFLKYSGAYSEYFCYILGIIVLCRKTAQINQEIAGIFGRGHRWLQMRPIDGTS